MRKFIIDTDTASDDAAALIMAALDINIEILGVTSVAGNVSVEQATKMPLLLWKYVIAMRLFMWVLLALFSARDMIPSVFTVKTEWVIAE